jgi:hypothetical protein
MILSVAVITKEGRALVARQFNYLTRSQVEGHLGAFPKLVGKERQSYVETETIRYVFQSIEDLYFVLITSKDSNILEDLDLLSLLVDLTRDILSAEEGGIHEKNVLASSLQLIFAYDECIFDGYRQNVSVGDVREFLAMESVEEVEFLRLRRIKEVKAATELKQKMRQLEKDRKKSGKTGFESSGIASQLVITSNIETTAIEQSRPKYSSSSHPSKQGMALGKKVTSKSKAQQMIIEEGLGAASETTGPSSVQPVSSSGVVVKLIEVMNATVSRNGVVREMSVEGRLITESGLKGNYLIQISETGNSNKFKMRPINQKDRGLFSKTKCLQFESASHGEEMTLLGWRMVSVDQKDVPFLISGWVVDPNAKVITFSYEIELKDERFVFDSIVVSIPVQHPLGVKISVCDGEADVLAREEILKWTIARLGGNNQKAELEFSMPHCDPERLYPMIVEFESSTLFSDLDVVDVRLDGDSGGTVKYDVVKNFTAGQFEIA